MDEHRVEVRPDSLDPEHKTIEVDLASQAVELCGVAVGALIGDGFNRPEYEFEGL